MNSNRHPDPKARQERMSSSVVVESQQDQLDQLNHAYKQLQEELSAAQEVTQLLAEQTETAIYEIDFRVPCFTAANDAMCRLSGYSREELLAMNPFDLLDEHSRVIFSERIKKNMAGETVDPIVEYKVIGKGGRVIYALLHTTMRYHEGKAYAAYVIGHDITERKLMENSLQKKNLMLSLLTDAASELLAGADPIEKLDEFFKRAGKALGLEVYVQYNLSEDGTHLNLGRLSGFPERYHQVLQRLELGQAVCGTVALTRKPMAVTHVQERKDRTTRLIRKLGLGTYACHPLMVGERLLGTLSFGSRSCDEFDKETIDILRTFCNMVAEAIARKQAEAALQESEERERLRAAQLEAILEALPVGLVITDELGGVTLANQAYELIWGDPRPNPTSVGDYQAYRAWWADTGKAITPEEWASAQAVQQGKTVIGQILEIQRFDGCRAFVLNSASPVRDKNGKIVGSAVAIQDITRLREAEKILKDANVYLEQRVNERTSELKQTNDRVQALTEVYELLTAGGTDLPGVLQSVVKKTAEIFGDACVLRLIDQESHLVDSVATYDPDPQRSVLLNNSVKPTLQQPIEKLIDDVLKLGAGRIFQVGNMSVRSGSETGAFTSHMKDTHATTCMVVPLHIEQEVTGAIALIGYDPKSTYTQEELVFLQDLADRAALAIQNARLYKHLEESLAKERYMRQQLIQSEKFAALARLVASVAHELNNPLQTIQNSIYLLKDAVPAGENQEILNIIVSEGNRMSSLVQQLRETYRPSSFKMEYFNVIDTVSQALNLSAPQLQQNKISWNLKWQTSTVMINGVPDQLKQVFINIILNAIDAMENHGGTLYVKVNHIGRKVCILFRDTGSGIKAEDMEKIFEPFYTTKEKGTGLGLAICYEIVNDHGGEITVKSKPGSGSTFAVWLPVKVK